MRIGFAMAAAAAFLGGCSQTASPGNAGDSGEAASAAEPAAPASGTRREGVYIAFAPERDSASMLATSGGRLEVVNDCLVLRSDLATYLPVFAPSADTYVTGDAAVIAGRSVPLGTEIETAGGEMGTGAEAMLQEPRPTRCGHRLLRVTSWGLVKR